MLNAQSGPQSRAFAANRGCAVFAPLDMALSMFDCVGFWRISPPDLTTLEPKPMEQHLAL